MTKDPNPDVKVFPSEEDPGFWNVLLRGSRHTPYDGYVFHLFARFPPEYPRYPPEVRFVTPLYHCNVNADGRICHSIFDRNYSPAVTFRDILNHVYALLMTPEPKDPLDSARAAEFFSTPDLYRANATNHCELYAFKTMHLAQKALIGDSIPEPPQKDGDVPEEFVCSLTGQMIERAAFLTVDQRNYEMEAIRAYISENGKSPVNGAPASLEMVVAIPFLERQIKDHRQQRQWFLLD